MERMNMIMISQKGPNCPGRKFFPALSLSLSLFFFLVFGCLVLIDKLAG